MVTLQVTSELFLIKVPLVGLFQNILLLGTKPQAVLTLNSRQACVWTIEPSWFIISFLTYNCSFNPCAWQTWLSHCTTQMETPSQLRPLYHNCTQMVKIETKVKMTPSRKKQSEKNRGTTEPELGESELDYDYTVYTQMKRSEKSQTQKSISSFVKHNTSST